MNKKISFGAVIGLIGTIPFVLTSAYYYMNYKDMASSNSPAEGVDVLIYLFISSIIFGLCLIIQMIRYNYLKKRSLNFKDDIKEYLLYTLTFGIFAFVLLIYSDVKKAGLKKEIRISQEEKFINRLSN